MLDTGYKIKVSRAQSIKKQNKTGKVKEIRNGNLDKRIDTRCEIKR